MKAISKNQVSVNTDEYRFDYGHEPKGRGAWAFSEKRDPDVLTEVKWYTGTYAAARKQAVAEAAANGIPTIYVQP